MRISLYVAIATRGDEELLCGAGTNRRLVEIQRDSYIMHNIDWSCEIQEFAFDVTPKKIDRVILPDEERPETGNILPKEYIGGKLSMTREEAEKLRVHNFSLEDSRLQDQNADMQGGGEDGRVSEETPASKEGE
jgi:hypothetical protein